MDCNLNVVKLWVRSISLIIVSTPRCSLGWAPGMTRANSTITHAHLGTAPKWPTPQARHWKLTRVSLWNDIKFIRTHRGQTRVDPGKLNLTHPKERSYGQLWVRSFSFPGSTPVCDGVFFPGRTWVIIFTRSSLKKKRHTPGSPQGG